MRPHRKTYGPYAAADADGICASQTPTGAGNLTINGALASGGVATLDTERNVIITSVGNDSARVFTIRGRDSDNRYIVEKVPGANAGVAKSQRIFRYVDSIFVDAATAGALTVGTVATNTSNWIPLDRAQQNFKASVAVQLSTGASMTYEIEHTFDDVQNPDVVPVAFDHEFMVGKTANDDGNYAFPVTALRLNITAYTGGSAGLRVTQGH